MIETRRLKNILIFIQKILHYMFFFCEQKTIKNRQALHEIFRASSLSIIFIGLSSRPVYPNMVLQKIEIYEKLQFLEDVLASQNIDSIFFYSYATTLLAATVSGNHGL